jgi:hypothetical protein
LEPFNQDLEGSEIKVFLDRGFDNLLVGESTHYTALFGPAEERWENSLM